MTHKLPKFHIGNIIRNPHGDIEIVTEVHWGVPNKPDTIEVVAAWAENCSGVHQLEDYERTSTCHCGDHPDFRGEPQDDCEDCAGAGRYTKTVLGWNRSKILAPCLKAFITRRALKAFNFGPQGFED